MPQAPTLMMEKEGNTLTYMWSVDAKEGAMLGDYTPVPPDKEISAEERASAMSRFKTGQGMTHPEMQTDDEKEETRRKANEKAALLEGIPEGAQVVVMAPSPGESRASSRTSGGTASRPAASTPPASSSQASSSTTSRRE